MKRMTCKCGSRAFNIDRKNPGRVTCVKCVQSYSWIGKEFVATTKIKRIIQEVEALFRTEQTPFEVRPEVFGQTAEEKKFKAMLLLERKAARQRNHLTRVIYMEKPEATLDKLQGLNPQERIRYRWQNELKVLEYYGVVSFKKHDHKGKLRGKHIAKAFLDCILKACFQCVGACLFQFLLLP